MGRRQNEEREEYTMSDLRPLQVPGSGVHSQDNIACSRTDIRQMRERELREQQMMTPAERELERRKQIAAAYAAEWEQEQQRKLKDDADAVKRGTRKVLPNGTIVESYSGFRRN